MSVEATPWTDEGRDDLSLGTRAQNADARRGRLVRGVMLAVVLLYVGTLLLAPLGGIVYSAFKSGVDGISARSGLGVGMNSPSVRFADLK